MAEQNTGPIHKTEREASAGSKPNVVRWVLAFSLGAAIITMSAAWMLGAAFT